MGMSFEDVVWNIPLSFLLLMVRERIAMEGKKKGISLSTIQFIDEQEESNNGRNRT